MKLPVLMCLLFAGFVLSEVDPTKDIKPARGVFEVRETLSAHSRPVDVPDQQKVVAQYAAVALKPLQSCSG